ncbi:cobalamin biosynthesis protein CbiX [Streptomyces castrisilvae]|uniref:Cobalamin biosynthesis protein CbiX n=1 Tax=Streptomyces castrisilvae TaxID=3033811 RepID=A0ABY9HUL6_9ACTN|nr:cobalamin biosynthesis protein CbiX [Streptomyces sp. Mut1]WLQ37678.1 cobalamin biosynthesis protein CbiX [Streptomyces sp. Mut1]
MTVSGAVIAVCGHEADYGRALDGRLGPHVSVVPNGRALFRAVAAHRRRGEDSVVVPMTLGREPGLVADTARTLRALPAGGPGAALLAEPFGTTQHLVAHLRAAAGRVPASSALLVTAPSGDPFEDAELYRVAALVRRYGRHDLVEVAFGGGDPDPADGVRRCALLGAERVALLPASFAPVDAGGAPPVPAESAGPLMPASALRRVLDERVADARRRWAEHGDDGVATGLVAADHHGHAHTHPPGEGHDHGHTHGHTHGHAHDHGPATGHRHHHPSADGADRAIRSIA